MRVSGTTRARDSRRIRPGKLVAGTVAAVIGSYYGPAVLERFLPRPVQRRFQRRFGNPGGRIMSRLPGWAIVETTGRRTAAVRQVPVGGRIIGEAFWFVAADPDHAGYVKNLEANPHVRVRVGGRWRTGVAVPLPEDNPRRRMFRLNPANGLFIMIAGRRHLTIRVQLDP
ncbi:MAG TPA: nitroreductase/quinone reductase family protein [Acidimicrobiales bacterium]|nr:nitroreductase/quinone reductase family protein [Acidimicrobiales bacterium]